MGKFLERWRWALVIGGLLLLAFGYAFWPEAKLVDLGTASKGPMAVGVTDDGVTREKELYVVSAPVTGFASRITLEAGDPVARGQIITRMTGRPVSPLDRRTREELRGQLASAKAAEDGATAELAQARRDLARAESLAPSGFISRAQLEQVRTRVSTGQAALAQSRAEVQRIRASLSEPGGTTAGAPVAVVAPVSGSVLLVPEKSEGVITEGTPLVTIGDPDKIEVVVDLLSREAVRVKPGDRVEITQWGGSKPLIGRVKYIEPYGRLKVSALGIEEQRVNVVIGFDAFAARQATRLGHGYQIDATIIVWSKPDALRVPIGALFRGKDGGWRVFVDDSGLARERVVKIDHLNDDYGEVINGLADNASVVLNPASDLKEGDRIRAR
ncbi:efflux RND transporter periplasmic adaptor subunit [Novosphingobium pentaromativorans]|uniref:Efflux transporter, RND family, MFP subunit n=1 Tax=Novosphingobium pentaromativorans US6-1 TaxID=1088721 RepID=G6EFT1_9SPHN|nr:efflux RND transporter periplasmic adaptor subunit [Novosphingobium pentaromativorans]AIT81806.1 RND transporter [Novosphingobium pentaromativorans US6-1]EHJ59859.1 efflux transporter, RND family, MFP subunit [Novosphingobium pentaromativorans US6-1]